MTENGFEPAGPVVVGVDGSTSSEAALRWGAKVASSSERDLRVVLVERHPQPQYVVPRAPVWPWPQVRTANPVEVAHNVELLESLVTRTLEDDENFEAVVRTGDPANELLREAQQRGASLLVVGRRGLGGFKRLMLGSVSDQLAGHASCPVAVIPHDASDAHGPVIVGVDGSEDSVVASRWAAEYALAHGVQLRIVTCWDVGPAPYAYATLIEETSSLATRVVSEAEARLRAYAPDLEIVAAAPSGTPGKVLAELATQQHAELVVVGSRGLGGFEELLLGSVAHQTLHHAHTSVVIVR